MVVILFLAMLLVPFLVIGAEIVFLILTKKKPKLHPIGLIIDAAGFLIMVAELLAMYELLEIDRSASWSEQLHNNAVHSPFEPEYAWVLVAVTVLGLLSFIALNAVKADRVPPLVPLLLIAALETMFLFSVVFAVQHSKVQPNEYSFIPYVLYIWFIPAFIGLMFARTCFVFLRKRNLAVRERIASGEPAPEGKLQKLLFRAEFWPLFAFLLVWPILAVLAGVSMIVSETPDAAVKVFTETADWVLSTKIPPQQLYHDEHYLCTVAAGGHPKLVKPLRKGIRHGHPVVVNRQLQIANAFEQILEERTPRFHKAVRGFYDRYGFPVAKLIRTKAAADAVYLLMKPLEWIFLFVLYVSDVHPENRIALQYTGGLYEKEKAAMHR
ncbi:MAG: hypothetical protein J5794_06330 [Lachnospiraceae bacterium]|nr:hypothetical protein [Lachnospiraceae bacterium]